MSISSREKWQGGLANTQQFSNTIVSLVRYEVKINFYENIKNLKSLTCYSNEADKWRLSNIKFENTNTLLININEKFVGERGRINCSLRDPSGFWRWLGIQFVVSEK